MGEPDDNTNLGSRLSRALGAWQPLTGRGIAAFAAAGYNRLLVVQLLFALLATLTVVWCLRTAWFPTVDRALAALPTDSAGIRDGRLAWPSLDAQLLAANPFLAFVVDPASFADLGLNADLQVEFRSADVCLRGLLGQTVVPYSRTLALPLDRLGAGAAWGAWRKPVQVLVGVAAGLIFLIVTSLLGLFLIPFTALIGWSTRHQVTLGGAWKLGIAAWLPASLVFDSVLILYARHWISLTTLAAGLGLALLTGLFWTATGAFNLPRRASTSTAPNPFGEGTRAMATSTPGRSRNPFGD